MRLQYTEKVREFPNGKAIPVKQKQVAFIVGDWAIGLQYPLRAYGESWRSIDRYFWKFIWQTEEDYFDGTPTTYFAQLRFLWFAIAFKHHTVIDHE